MSLLTLTTQKNTYNISREVLVKAFSLMCQSVHMTSVYEKNRDVTSRYVHATSRGHEAVQIAMGLHLHACDYLSVYYRDDSLLLAIGLTPYELMLQLLGKKDDPFSGGRMYYSHPSLKRDDMPKIPMQSSATGMQAIPATGMAMGISYREKTGLLTRDEPKPVTVCSLGDACVTEGEVAEAFQMAVLKKLPVLYLVQDNGWDISATADEIRAQNAAEYARGFKGLEAVSINGSDFFECYHELKNVVDIIRNERRPFLVHATVPLLTHHTSGVRKEWYRHDLQEAELSDPFPLFRLQLIRAGIKKDELDEIENRARQKAESDFEKACQAPDPDAASVTHHVFAPTPVTEETGNRCPAGKQPVVMVDAALFAIREIMSKHPECLFYGQDVGRRLGGVFREAATLAKQFGDERVFNTPIQEAFIIGSTVGMSAVGLKPIVEVQFADYIWPGLNQLFTEVSRSNYLSNGKWPVSMILRVPTGAYGSGGPYHSSSVESVLCNIKGIKVVYPSTGADLKGLLKAAYYDPNPVVMLEHKGLYWSKIRGTEEARTIEPDENYVIPLGKARKVQSADEKNISEGKSLCIITYGMGVYWSLCASRDIKDQVEILDLRTLVPLDEKQIIISVRNHGRCMVITEEPKTNSFAQALAGFIQENCFESLDAPVKVIGALDLPAISLNTTLEQAMLPDTIKIESAIRELLMY